MEPSSTKRAEDLRPDMLEFIEVRLLVWNRFGDASSRTPGVGGLGKGKPCLLIVTKEALSLEEVLRVERLAVVKVLVKELDLCKCIR